MSILTHRLDNQKVYMDNTYHFAVDLGATSGRTILAGYDGARVHMQELTRFKYPMLPLNGHLYWNLPLIYQEILDGLKKCVSALAALGSDAGRLASIGIDSWGCDVAFFHKDGSLSGLPYCYRDSHTAGAVERFCEKMSKDEVYDRTGIQFMDFNTLFQIDTIRRDSPEVIDSADKILFIPDALAYMLTGRAVMEYTVASTSQMLNPATGDLDNGILEALGISREKFGETVQPGGTIGHLSGQVQDYTGLGSIPIIAVAGHDTASAVVAVPSPDSDFAYISCGTWSLLGTEVDRPVITAKSREYNFTNEGGIDSTTRLLKNICGLWIFERCREEFTDVPGDVAAVADLCLDSECDSIINPDDPMFANPSSMTQAISEYCRLSGHQVPSSPADYVRVIFRSLAVRYREVLGYLAEICPVDIKRLHIIGGGSRNVHLMQYAADETGLPVVAGPAECTALGNVLVQLRACGELKSLSDMRRVAVNSTETVNYLPK